VVESVVSLALGTALVVAVAGAGALVPSRTEIVIVAIFLGLTALWTWDAKGRPAPMGRRPLFEAAVFTFVGLVCDLEGAIAPVLAIGVAAEVVHLALARAHPSG
jgi:hypothetical protein